MSDDLERFLESIEHLRGNGNPDLRLPKAKAILNKLVEEAHDLGMPENWEEYLRRETDDSYDWLARGFLERGERVVVVAGEGVGKSMLARQLAICLAAGLHPFTQERINPIRTLTVDLENPPKIFRRTSRRMMDLARQRSWLSKEAPIQAFFRLLPAGVNLLKVEDQMGIEAMIEEIQPDILFMGPLYKSFIDPGGRSPESIATEIAMFYDRLRANYGCALWLEQHAPLGNSLTGRDLRPFGSAVWSRWPEFGLTLAPSIITPGSYDVGYFRGARDERQFPKVMHRGEHGEFPFVVDEFM